MIEREYKLRVCRIANAELPVGMPVTFQGNNIGKVINKNEIVIDNDMVYSMIRNDEVRFSLEVTCK